MKGIGFILVVFLVNFGAFVQSNDDPQLDCTSCNTMIRSEEDPGILSSKMKVYIESIGPPGSYMCTKCWSGNHDKDRCCCVSSGNTQVLQWEFTAGSTTKFWCQAAWGAYKWDRKAYMTTFPVFGDGVPKKSSDWRVNAAGRVRFQEDGKPKDDYEGYWIGTKP